MRNKLSIKQTTLLGALLAISLVLSIVESMLGALIPLPIPGVKLGLANIVSMFILYYFSLEAALAVGVLRALLSSLFTGGVGMFLYSGPGVVLSILVMYAAARHVKGLSVVGVSMLGACMYNVAQVCIAVWVTAEVNLFYYAFILLAVGAVSGTITGIVAKASFQSISDALKIQKNLRNQYSGGAL